jgi:hypothetical protein|tara:strand:- start:2210 stop:2362 length:153 start_codon:yes stop_codon:yes gene_type:complete
VRLRPILQYELELIPFQARLRLLFQLGVPSVAVEDKFGMFELYLRPKICG